MKISDIITETTTAGAIATVSMPLGQVQSRMAKLRPPKTVDIARLSIESGQQKPAKFANSVIRK